MSAQNTVVLNAPSAPNSPALNKGAQVTRIGGGRESAALFSRLRETLGKIGIQQSFALVGVLFVLPISLLLYYFVTELSSSVQFSAKERLGVVYLDPALNLIRNLPEHQRYALAVLGGQETLRGELDALGVQIDKSMTAIDAASAKQGDALALSTQWKSIRSQWQNLRAALPSMSADQSAAAHGSLIAAITAYVLDVADKSNLTLDPDVDTYYLMTSATVLLPNLIDQLARVRALGIVAGAGATISEQERGGWSQLVQGGLEHSAQQLADALSRTFAANAGVQQALETPLRTLVRAVSETAKAGRDGGLDTASSGALKAWVDRTNKTFDAVEGLIVGTAAELDKGLVARVERMQRRLYLNAGISSVVALLAIVILIVLARASARSVRDRDLQATRIREENGRNQAAILRLLDEMGSLADGDLTIKAKVTEDITGAIADSVNYTVGELSSLVRRVNSASAEVTTKASGAEQLSSQLRDAAIRQAEQIRQASAQILSVAESVKQVTSRATESARVAAESLQAAEAGGAAVDNSIKGMNDIRDNIQETAKRIKRLGESSQEIGDIVELISEITEQTNVLALNAAIQAAAAGEQGRGFAVVAEEVQRLAERSGEATKQIGALVKTIQRDTQDAVSAMERSTTGVVDGAKLADAAGESLRKIRTVSGNLAGLIEGIFGSAQQQTAVTENVVATMHNILEITDENTQGTTQVSESVAQLSALATDLKQSVAGFKL